MKFLNDYQGLILLTLLCVQLIFIAIVKIIRINKLLPHDEAPKVGKHKESKELNICPHCGVNVTNPKFSCCKLYENDHPEIFNG